MIISLTEKQFDYLENTIKNQEELNIDWNVKRKNKIVIIEVDDDILDTIRDWAMDKQVQIGFDSNYALNPEGEILEEIIDAFYME
ncbi:hypothetical protein [Chryseobacterium sp.]|uniref:hypothetical protein n=1 Tax=Chryseobacterium sp. TaxID=1871047 RepID=UPI002FC62D8B